MPIALAPLAINLGLTAISSIAGSFRGKTEIESYSQEVLPIVKPYALRNSIPVFSYHYGLVWGYDPTTDTIIDISPSQDQTLLKANESGMVIQEWVNQTGNEAALLNCGPYGSCGSQEQFTHFYPENILGKGKQLLETLQNDPKKYIQYAGFAGIGLVVLLFAFKKGV